ncbi:YcaO-like family protein [Streptomyces sp. NPDC060232]|uniref:YcaO-like family protein n=1 Tax=Streptomyces sp. NPDC060232 TaxID=3347079 RepID=UPI003659512B
MIDFLGTLDRTQGLAERCEVQPPAPPTDLLWRALVRITPAAAPQEPVGRALDPCVVGAYGHSRSDALTRGVGEAVERYALFPSATAPPGTVRATAREAGGQVLAFHGPDTALGDPRAADEVLTWYPARRLRDGAEILVPAPLVDYPNASPEARHFDPTPSGAASGHGYTMALRAGLMEVIERDAFLIAWEERLRLARVTPFPLTAGDAAAGLGGKRNIKRRNLAALWQKTEQAGLVPVLADLPTAVPGVVCTVAAVIDETGAGAGPLATVGCNASDDPWWSMLGALQEALQVRSVILNSWDEHGFGRAPARIDDDDDRLRHLASPEGYEQVREWVDGFVQYTSHRTAVEVPTDTVVRSLVADGADPLAIDLTHRLPAGLREMGWAAVKVIPVGYQPLRLVESHDFSWHTGRLRTAEARTGRRAGPVSAFSGRPHPLP